ncbi:MAG TPA: 4-alpha-glucanotransferase [Aggregatilineales bacterium]|nr:4-alpha-glucanotransferase [Anaerolineales bacterium]HRE46233.1 4-alpha-glucanotransferase [Aggregatilineales bacterium]
MEFPRASGILLHPTSLPGRYGIGDLGTYAYRFVDYLVAAGQTYWQILPLGPTSYADSPYQTLSAMAGNPNLISLESLVWRGWLTQADLADVPDFPTFKVDYGPVIDYHTQILAKAYERFTTIGDAAEKTRFEAWCAENAEWLDDFALFVALKNSFNLRPWTEWTPDYALRKPEALAKARKDHATAIRDQKFRQWVFHEQWAALKAYANGKGIRFVGDIPIFVAHDSSDVWANPSLYYLNPDGSPTVVAGVPPDYFSATGQRWGNPLYRWDVMAKDGYAWWIRRFKATLAVVDIVRVDHFRGFEAYWEIPGTEPTAVKGQWLPGPNKPFFEAMVKALGDLPIIAEDLGVITPGVVALRDDFNLPGMKVLQFAFSYDPNGENVFLPHNYTRNSICYSGTHDNNTTLGWWQSSEASYDARNHLEAYIGHPVSEPHIELIRLGMSSVAHTFIAPLQDVFGFGADTRMNIPGTTGGNWAWRFTEAWFDNPARERYAFLTRQYGRWNPPPSRPEGESRDWAVGKKD